ncbi:MAG: hypothetical protein AAF557_06840 [Pseudomonadota bacterium]
MLKLPPSLKALIPDSVAQYLPNSQRKRHIQTLLTAGQVVRAAELIAQSDPWPDGALWEQVDLFLDAAHWDELPKLQPLADLRPVFERAVFEALAGIAEFGVVWAQQLLDDLGNDQRWDGFQRMCARALSAFLAMPRLKRDVRLDLRPGILQFWEQGQPPSDLAEPMAAWQQLAGGGYRLLDGTAARSWLDTQYGTDAVTTYDLCSHPAIKADYLRLGYLAKHGGVWIDADSKMSPGFSNLYARLGTETVLWFNTKTGHWLNGFIAAPEGDPLMARAFHDAGARIREKPDQHPYLLAGPGLLTDTILWMHRDGLLKDTVNITTAEVNRSVFGQIKTNYKKSGLGWQDQLGQGSAR